MSIDHQSMDLMYGREILAKLKDCLYPLNQLEEPHRMGPSEHDVEVYITEAINATTEFIKNVNDWDYNEDE
jgi:hypothetical protein